MIILNNIKLKDIGKENSIRTDLNYIKYFENKNSIDTISFDNLFTIVEPESVNLDELDEFKYCQIGDTDGEGSTNPVIINFNEEMTELDDYYKKIKKGDIFKPQKGDILISKIRPYLKKIIIINNNNEDIYFTKAFICLRPKINSIIAFFLLRTVWSNDLNSISRTGKGYPTLNTNDFKYLKFNKKILNIIDRIQENKDMMNELKKYISNINSEKKLLDDKEIINNAFFNYFSLKKEIIDQIHKGMTFGTQKCTNKSQNAISVKLSDIRNKNYRCSTRINNPSNSLIYNKIFKLPHKKISDIRNELVKGVQPQYCEDGIKVVKISNLKNSNIDFENVEYASEIFCNKLSESKFLKQGDIIICCTGKGSLGKVDIVECDETAITSVDNYILRINNKIYNAKFLVYYLRSVLGVVQFEINYTGMTNQIHFYDNNIDDILIPDIDFKEQKKLEKMISDEIDKNKRIKEKIKNEKEKIIKNLELFVKNEIK